LSAAPSAGARSPLRAIGLITAHGGRRATLLAWFPKGAPSSSPPTPPGSHPAAVHAGGGGGGLDQSSVSSAPSSVAGAVAGVAAGGAAVHGVSGLSGLSSNNRSSSSSRSSSDAEADWFGLPRTDLVQMLAPPSALCNQPFMLGEQWGKTFRCTGVARW
jgi:hypothetical protein